VKDNFKAGALLVHLAFCFQQFLRQSPAMGDIISLKGPFLLHLGAGDIQHLQLENPSPIVGVNTKE